MKQKKELKKKKDKEYRDLAECIKMGQVSSDRITFIKLRAR